MIDSYLRGIDAVTGATRVQARASVAGAKLLPSSAISSFSIALPPGEPPDGASTLVGLAAGGMLWSDHRVLGMLLGASLGRNVPALVRSEMRRSAACNIAQTTGGVVGSLAVGAGGTTFQIAGFIAGWLAAGAALYYSGVRDDSSRATVAGV